MNRTGQLRARVRQAWVEAFAVGRVADHEEQVGDDDQLNIGGATDALLCAEAEVGPDSQRVRAHWQVRSLADQVFERILVTEGAGSGGDALEQEQLRRADAVVDALVDAVYPGQ